MTFGYDPEGNLTAIGLPNGVQTTNAFDDDGLLSQTTSTKGQTTLQQRSYGYDASGNRTSQTDETAPAPPTPTTP